MSVDDTIPADTLIPPDKGFAYMPVLRYYTVVLLVSSLPPGKHKLSFTVAGDPITHSIPFTLIL